LIRYINSCDSGNVTKIDLPPSLRTTCPRTWPWGFVSIDRQLGM